MLFVLWWANFKRNCSSSLLWSNNFTDGSDLFQKIHCQWDKELNWFLYSHLPHSHIPFIFCQSYSTRFLAKAHRRCLCCFSMVVSIKHTCLYWNTCKQNCLVSHCKKSCCGAATNFFLSPNSKLYPSVESVLLSLADDIQGEDFKSSQIIRVGDLQSLKSSTRFISWESVTLICFLLERGTLHGFGMRSR